MGRKGREDRVEGKGCPLIAFCDKYHSGYNLNVHGICVVLILRGR